MVKGISDIGGRISICVSLLVAWLGSGCSHEFKACDIRESDCQEEVFLQVQDVRGAGIDPWLSLPPIRVISRQQFFREVDEEVRQAGQPTSEDLAWERALQLVRLISPDLSAAEASGANTREAVAAYYSSLTRSITVIDRGDATDRRDDVYILAHELVHAAQDREIGIRWYREKARTLDEAIARTAVIEGDAVLFSNLVTIPLFGLEPGDVDWRNYHSGMLTDARDYISDSASPYFAISILVYPLGSKLMTNIWLSGGSPATRAVFGEPAPNMRALMTGSPGAPAESLRCTLPGSPAGLQLLSEPEEFGASLLYAFLTRWLDDDPAWALGKQWAGDGFAVFATTDAARVYVSWRVQMSSPTTARELANAVNAGGGTERRAEAFDTAVSIVATNDAQLLEAHPPSCP